MVLHERVRLRSQQRQATCGKHRLQMPDPQYGRCPLQSTVVHSGSSVTGSRWWDVVHEHSQWLAHHRRSLPGIDQSWWGWFACDAERTWLPPQGDTVWFASTGLLQTDEAAESRCQASTDRSEVTIRPNKQVRFRLRGVARLQIRWEHDTDREDTGPVQGVLRNS